MPTISFITCVYNASKWLERCLCSILEQDDKDFEAVIIDDGSTDDSYRILKRFQSQSPALRIYRQSNHGTAYTTNRAVLLSRGDYVVNVDDDDWVEPNLVSSIKRIILKHHPSIVSFLGKDDAGKQFPDSLLWEKPVEAFYENRVQIQKAIKEKKVNYFTHTTQAIKRQFLIDFPFEPPASGADRASMIQIYTYIDSCYVIDEVFYHYNWRSDSQSHIHPIAEPIWNLIRLAKALPRIAAVGDPQNWPLPQLREVPVLFENAWIACVKTNDSKTEKDMRIATRTIRKYWRLIYVEQRSPLTIYKYRLWTVFPIFFAKRSLRRRKDAVSTERVF